MRHAKRPRRSGAGVTDRRADRSGSGDIVRDIERRGREAFAFADRGACGDMLIRLARRGDRIVVMGARDDSLSQFSRELRRQLAGQAVR